MDSDIPRPEVRVGPAVRVGGHPILRILVSFPIACFCGALVTDLAYVWTADMIWADFSAWLLAVGMVFGVLAAIAGIVDFVANWRVRMQTRIWPVLFGSVVVLVLGLFDNLVHSRDAWTSVMPTGLLLSAATVVVLLVTAWVGSATIYRQPGYSGVRP
jgi:uncharacterized membrane protein